MGRRSVLVVDDSPSILRRVQLVLTEADYQVTCAPDGETGLQLAKESRPGPILLDDSLPDMTAFDLLDAMSGDIALARTPAVISHTRAQEIDDRISGSPNVRHAISKPQQTTALVYEALRWREGRFAFYATGILPATADKVRLALNVDGLLLEGLRRIDEWRLIEQEIEDFDEVFLRNDEKLACLGRGKMLREELCVLELVNGRNRVKEIVCASKMASFDVTKVLYRLRRSKLIRKRVAPVVAGG